MSPASVLAVPHGATERFPVSVSVPTSRRADPEGYRTGCAACGSDLTGSWAARAGGSERHAEVNCRRLANATNGPSGTCSGMAPRHDKTFSVGGATWYCLYLAEGRVPIGLYDCDAASVGGVTDASEGAHGAGKTEEEAGGGGGAAGRRGYDGL